MCCINSPISLHLFDTELVSLISGHRRPTDCEFDSGVGEETPLSALAELVH
jgi:hypothetical protein